MEKKQFIKVKVGEVYIDGKSINVYETFFEKKSEKGDVYYVSSKPAWITEVQVKEDAEEVKASSFSSQYEVIKNDRN